MMIKYDFYLKAKIKLLILFDQSFFISLDLFVYIPL